MMSIITQDTCANAGILNHQTCNCWSITHTVQRTKLDYNFHDGDASWALGKLGCLRIAESGDERMLENKAILTIYGSLVSLLVIDVFSHLSTDLFLCNLSSQY